MDKDVVLKKIKYAVKQAESNATIVLFGSRARGTENADSDWDILVLLDKAKIVFKDEQNIRHRIYDVELEVGEPISTFVYSLADWNAKMSVSPLYKSVQKEGIYL